MMHAAYLCPSGSIIAGVGDCLRKEAEDAHEFFILSRDAKGAVLCRGGTRYKVTLDNGRDKSRPAASDLGGGLHAVAFRAKPPFNVTVELAEASASLTLNERYLRRPQTHDRRTFRVPASQT
jgi:hypothetical protein